MFHELAHATFYNQAGSNWYDTFVNAVIHEMISNLSNNTFPYGPGNNPTYSPIIAVGESWPYHYGRFLANQRYGANADICVLAQRGGTVFCGTGAYLTASENFNPTLQPDPFRWIPDSVYLDLMDGGVEPQASRVNDQVTGYTNQQMFTAFNSTTRSPQAYRDRLLQLNNKIVFKRS
jgi:hypothetical protein